VGRTWGSVGYVIWLQVHASSPLSHSHSYQDPPSTPPILLRPPRRELIAPELIGCLLVKRQPNGELLWGVIVDIDAFPRMMYVLCRLYL